MIAAAAAAATKFDSTSLAEAVRRGRECRNDKRASEPEKETAMTETGKAEAVKAADSSEEDRQRRRDLSDV